MFKNRSTKKKSLSTVDNLLSTYLQTSDKKISKSVKHNASSILESKAQSQKKRSKSEMKKFKLKERKLRNKNLKRNQILNEKIDMLTKLQNGDDKLINDLELQNDVLNLISKESTKDKLKNSNERDQLRARISKLDNFSEKVSRGYISVNGLTPGLAQPGDDSDSEEDDDNYNQETQESSQLRNFRDDFDDYN
ncbi:hypothetical protein CAS74_002010 [Pichia kudriavzevii]|uniref:Regulator of rDNA transcription 14 n=1 Tax=Pichia kudriavzevii TaxID=4909 RepID=A0A1Z8JP02_PICKU|nr:hypothetical protein CAS74_002010 [Pichia kudriavzevii]